MVAGQQNVKDLQLFLLEPFAKDLQLFLVLEPLLRMIKSKRVGNIRGIKDLRVAPALEGCAYSCIPRLSWNHSCVCELELLLLLLLLRLRLRRGWRWRRRWRRQLLLLLNPPPKQRERRRG